MRYNFYSAAVILFTVFVVVIIYLVFGNSSVCDNREIKTEKAGETYEMDTEILELEHGNPT